MIRFFDLMSTDEKCDYEDIVCYAMRYCIGRQTYAVSFICDFYGLNIKKWSHHSLSITIKDIDSAYSLGDESIDKPHWLKLRGMIYSELLLRGVGDELKLLDKYGIPARCPHDE